MTTQALARVLNAALVCLVVWPLLHYGLVKTVGLNPWKLGGLAMYTTPCVTQVDLWDETSSPVRALSPRDFPAHLQRSVDHFSLARSALGELKAPSHLASRIFETVPEIHKVRITITVTTLNGSDSKLARRVMAYRYSRRQ